MRRRPADRLRRRRAVMLAAAALALLAAGCGDDADGAGAGAGGGGGGGGDGTTFALRPVLGSTDPPCPPATAGGEGAEDVDVLPEVRDGQTQACLEVGPAIVDTGDVRSAALGRTLGGPSVSVVLGRTGAANLDDFAGRSVGKRLAIVVFDRIVRAPTIQTTSFVGRIEIVGLSEEEASKLIEEFDRRS